MNGSVEPVVVLEPLAVKKTTAAKLLDCGLTKIRYLIIAGKLKTIKIGADQRVTMASLRKFVESGGE